MFLDDILRAFRFRAASRPKAKPVRQPPSLVGRKILIHYETGYGAESFREIHITNTFRNGGAVYFEGFCAEAETELTFRADRVEQLIDTATGRRFGGRDAQGWLEHHIRS